MKTLKIFLTTLFLSVLFLTGCGLNSSQDSGGDSSSESQEEVQDNSDGETTEEADASKTTIKIATNGSHLEMVENAIGVLEENSDYTAEIEVFDDVVQPNVALDERSVDVNFFQHKPYLASFNENNGTNLVPWGDEGVYLLQFGMYSENISSVDEITEGSQIVFGRDPSNRAIALKFLEELGLLTLDSEAKLPDLTNIVENPLDLQLTEVDITAVSDALEDPQVTAVIVMGFSLANSGKDPSNALAYASNDLALEYQQVLAVREEDKNADWGQALYDAFTSDTMAQYYEENLKGSVRLLD